MSLHSMKFPSFFFTDISRYLHSVFVPTMGHLPFLSLFFFFIFFFQFYKRLMPVGCTGGGGGGGRLD